MSPRYGQPIKESPKIERITVSFTIDEKEHLDKYCTKNNIRLSELCRKEVLKLIEEKNANDDLRLKNLRKEAKRMGWKISKGYQKTRLDNKFVLDENGNKIVGYTITDSANAYIAGLESTVIYTLNFEELAAYFEQK